jgi:hypothetical protein
MFIQSNLMMYEMWDRIPWDRKKQMGVRNKIWDPGPVPVRVQRTQVVNKQINKRDFQMGRVIMPLVYIIGLLYLPINLTYVPLII